MVTLKKKIIEIILEIDKKDVHLLGLRNEQKISFLDFKKKLAKKELEDALDKSYADAVKHGYTDMEMEEINKMIKEAKEGYRTIHDKVNS